MRTSILLTIAAMFYIVFLLACGKENYNNGYYNDRYGNGHYGDRHGNGHYGERYGRNFRDYPRPYYDPSYDHCQGWRTGWDYQMRRPLCFSGGFEFGYRDHYQRRGIEDIPEELPILCDLSQPEHLSCPQGYRCQSTEHVNIIDDGTINEHDAPGFCTEIGIQN